MGRPSFNVLTCITGAHLGRIRESLTANLSLRAWVEVLGKLADSIFIANRSLEAWLADLTIQTWLVGTFQANYIVASIS
jgi:hypothetical protein